MAHRRRIVLAVETAFRRPSFEASLKTSLALTRGVGVATFSRATTASVIDFEGLIKTAKIGEARFQGARRVENLFSNTENFAAAFWQSALSNTGTGVLPVLTNNFGTAPDGAQTAARLQCNLGGGTTSGDASNILLSVGTTTAHTKRITLWMKTNDGSSKTVQLRFGSGAGILNKQIDGTWRRYVTDAVTDTDNTVRIGLRGAAGNSDTADILIWHPMPEYLDGQSNQNPSEYVSAGVLSFPYHGVGVDGVKDFAYLNGNTVESNVVTEVAGAAIDDATLKGYLAEGARTQYLGITAAPATQTTGSLATDSYVLWVVGAGSASVAGATATITGAGTATDGAPVAFTVTGAGTVTVTVSGSLSFFQLENGAFPSSRIANTGAAGTSITRNADQLTYPSNGNFNETAGAFYVEATANATGLTVADASRFILSCGVAGRFPYIGTSLPYTQFQMYDGTNILASTIGATINGTVKKMAGGWGGGTMKVASGGAVQSGVFDGAMGTSEPIQVGGRSGTDIWFGNICNVKLWKRALSDAQLMRMTT